MPLSVVRKTRWIVAFLSIMLCVNAAGSTPPRATLGTPRLNLHTGWELQSDCKLRGANTPAELKADAAQVSGAAVSSSSYRPNGWIPTTVPTTVVAAQVANGIIKDPFYGTNLRNLPGMDYPPGSLFSNFAMLETSPYNCGWWYRTQFRTPAEFSGRSVALHLDGVNYRADVWLNGKQIARRDDLAGTWRVFELNVDDSLQAGKLNVLAIEVYPQTERDLGITWVDWNPSPPDKNTGLFRDVYLTASGPVELRFPYIASKLGDNNSTAHLTAMVEAWNNSSRALTATITWEIEGKKIHQEVALGANEKKTVIFGPDNFPELTISNPQLWWPAQYGDPHLERSHVSATVAGKFSDSHQVRFGIREITSEMNNGHKLFKVNGKPIVIRGGGWAPDMLLRSDAERMDIDFRYVRDMGLNTIRLEGKLEDAAFYDMADKYGILIMPGWCCCDMWERWNDWGPEQWKIAEAAMRDQARLLRNHPSVFVWLYGSDNPPPVDVEKMYLRILHEEHWPNPTISSASATPTLVSGPSGVKMTGPYDYVPPDYWLMDTKEGGAHGFNTETSPGPAIPPPESMRRFLPADKLWPQNDVWGYHAGGERFQTIDFYNTSLAHRYGAPKNFDDFIRKAYAMDYEGERAMFESYVRNKYNSTGVIQWMLNNAWPSIIWHLYDYYLVPAGGYFGTKKADEPVHVLYSYNDRAAVLVSENGQPLDNVTVTAKLYNVDATEQWSQEAKVNVTPDVAVVAFTVPSPAALSPTYFLKLIARDANGRTLSDNFYWLSNKPDELDWAKTTGVNTPQSAYADMTALQALPKVAVMSRMSPPKLQSGETRGYVAQSVELSNAGKSVAFMIHLRLVNTAGQDIVPTFWSDNFVSLLPGERRSLVVSYRPKNAGQGVHLQVDGWNVEPERLALR